MAIDHVRVRDVNGNVVQHLELQDLVERDRGAREPHELGLCAPVDQPADYYTPYFCNQHIVLGVPRPGSYEIEIVLWFDGENREGDATERRRLLDMSLGGHIDGDTWYRDMRRPGFDGEFVPNADSSLPWLAEQIVADPRFAEATVEFWWPAIMGRDVAEPPEDENDANFEGRLLASNAQTAEVERLARGFRRGFRGGSPYNLKDLLVEMVLSRWFRAESIADPDAVRAVALRNAGARRLLTPEELARKTLALTGFQWGRIRGQNRRSLHERDSSALTRGYGLLYGGIDSDGVKDRATDLTSVMAGVAQSHAVESSCPVVMKEFFLLPDERRRLFDGIDETVTPAFEFANTFEIAAASRPEREAFALEGHLPTGEATVSLAYLNDFWDEKLGDRDILLDRLTVYRGSTVVHRLEMEDFDHPVDCHHLEQGAFHLSSSGSKCVLSVPVTIPADGTYRIEVTAWADQAGDELPKLRIAVESDTEGSAGSRAIKAKLVDLYEALLGVRVSEDSASIRNAYGLFVDVWERVEPLPDGSWFPPGGLGLRLG